MYTVYMKRRYVVLLLLLLSCSSFLIAAEGQYYSLAISDSYYLGISHFEDEIPARSSNAFNVTVGFLGYRAKTWDLATQVHLLFVSDSLPFGLYRARGFNSIGLSLQGSYAFSPFFSLSAQVGSEVNFYNMIKEAFASFSFSIAPQFTLLERKEYLIYATIPVSVHLRKEITALQAGLGLRYVLFPFPRKEE